MMSKKIPRLYFAGEIMDVDGITGGFNFQHAWSSGMLAARSIALLQ
jgi:predicted flavoprotein YhiN